MKLSRHALLLGMVLLGAAGAAAAKPWWMHGVESNENDFLPADVAFRVSTRLDQGVLRVRWAIADGYYLYRRKIEIRAETRGFVLGAPVLPQGVIKIDPYLGTQETYRQQVEATLPYTGGGEGAPPLAIRVTYQGCADAGLCYPPITKVLGPRNPAVNVPAASHPWEGVAILGGGFAFLLAGLVLRKGRRLELPAL